MNVKQVLGGWVVALSLAAATGVHAQARWNMPTPYAEGNFHTQNIRQFAQELKEGSGGRIEVHVHSGASLYKLPEIKRAVQSGQVQLGEILMSALANEDPMYEASGVPFLATSFEQARKLNDIVRPHIEKRLARDGLRLLYTAPWPTVGVFLKGKGDIRGQKIRTYDRSTSKFIELLGGIPTTVQAAEVPQSFATGIIGGMVTSTTTAYDTKAWEYVKAYYDMKVSFPINMVIMNERVHRSLSANEQALIKTTAAQAEQRGWQRAEALQKEMDVKLSAQGVEIVQPDPQMQAALRRIGEQMAREWAERAGQDGAEIVKTFSR